MRAAQRPAPQGWPRGDGDGPLADGHAPVECGAHRVPPERRHVVVVVAAAAAIAETSQQFDKIATNATSDDMMISM